MIDKIELIVIGIAIVLAAFTTTQAIAQVDDVTVPAVNGTPVEVPTAAQAAENATNSFVALALAIISIVALIIKSGILDSVLSSKQKKQILDGAEATRVALVKALENKLLIRKSYELAFNTATPDKQQEYAKLIANLDDQIKYTTEQIQYYTDHFPKVNPDANRALPRESFNIATRKLIHEEFSREHGSVL